MAPVVLLIALWGQLSLPWYLALLAVLVIGCCWIAYDLVFANARDGGHRPRHIAGAAAIGTGIMAAAAVLLPTWLTIPDGADDAAWQYDGSLTIDAHVVEHPEHGYLIFSGDIVVAETGETLGSYSLGTKSLEIAGDGSVFFMAELGQDSVTAYSLDGTEKWTADGRVVAVSDGVAVLQSYTTGQTWGVDVDTGAQRWLINGMAPPSTAVRGYGLLGSVGSPAPGPWTPLPEIWFIKQNDVLQLLDLQTGELTGAAIPVDSTVLNPGASDALVAPDAVWIGAVDGADVRTYQLRDGEIAFESPPWPDDVTAHRVIGERVFVATGYEDARWYTITPGETAWTEIDFGVRWLRYLDTDGGLFLELSQDTLTARVLSGAVRWTHSINGPKVDLGFTPPYLSEHSIVFAVKTGEYHPLADERGSLVQVLDPGTGEVTTELMLERTIDVVAFGDAQAVLDTHDDDEEPIGIVVGS